MKKKGRGQYYPPFLMTTRQTQIAGKDPCPVNDQYAKILPNHWPGTTPPLPEKRGLGSILVEVDGKNVIICIEQRTGKVRVNRQQGPSATLGNHTCLKKFSFVEKWFQLYVEKKACFFLSQTDFDPDQLKNLSINI